MLDDEERSSNDFQDPETEIPDKLILRPLNPSQQGRLVSLSEGNLMEYDGVESEESYDESSESEDLPAPMSCRNCTNELEPYQQICTVCSLEVDVNSALRAGWFGELEDVLPAECQGINETKISKTLAAVIKSP